MPNWITREPLIGFLLLGGAMFLLNALINAPEREQIVLGSVAVEDLVEMRSELLGRPVAPPERNELINTYVDSEIVIREAVARGLHLNDPRVRKRLTDKMNFLLSEEPPEPTAEDLEALYAADPKRYQTPKTTSFEHIFFATDQTAAEALMARVRSGYEPAETDGDKFWLGMQMPRYAASQLLTLFGYQFERKLRKLPIGEWRGPIRSGRGWHLVRVQARHAPHDYPDKEKLRRLLAEWDAQHREQSRERRMVELRSHYEIVLPESVVEDPKK